MVRHILLPKPTSTKFFVRDFATHDFSQLDKLCCKGSLTVKELQQIKAFFMTSEIYDLLVIYNDCQQLPLAVIVIRLLHGVVEIIWDWYDPDSPVSRYLTFDVHTLDGQKVFS